MPLSLHTLTGRTKTSQQDESDIGELYARMVIRTQEAQHSLCSMIFGGVFERFPGLKIVSAENDIAWVPHLLERGAVVPVRERLQDVLRSGIARADEPDV